MQTIDTIGVFKAAGFDVYAPEKLTSYFWLVRGDAIGYCQVDKYGCMSFSTVHKANTTSGTGFGVDTAESAVDCFAPVWAYTLHHSVKKYKSIEEFLTVQSWCNPVKY